MLRKGKHDQSRKKDERGGKMERSGKSGRGKLWQFQ